MAEQEPETLLQQLKLGCALQLVTTQQPQRASISLKDDPTSYV